MHRNYIRKYFFTAIAMQIPTHCTVRTPAAATVGTVRAVSPAAALPTLRQKPSTSSTQPVIRPIRSQCVPEPHPSTASKTPERYHPWRYHPWRYRPWRYRFWRYRFWRRLTGMFRRISGSDSRRRGTTWGWRRHGTRRRRCRRCRRRPADSSAWCGWWRSRAADWASSSRWNAALTVPCRAISSDTWNPAEWPTGTLD